MSETVVKGRRIDQNFFVERMLRFKFIGGVKGDNQQVILSNNEENSVEVDGLQARVSIEIYGATMLPFANVEIYNLNESLANKISTMGLYALVASQKASQVIIYGKVAEHQNGDPVYSQIFQGGIVVAYDDWNATPERITHLQLQTMGDFGNEVVPSISFKGEVLTADIVRAIMINNRSSTLRVENMGVDTALNDPNFYGNIIEQLNQCAKAANFNYVFQGQVLYIYPKDGELVMKTPIRCDPSNGMLGYPKYSSNGIIIRNIFIPNVIYGQAVEVSNSEVKPANGRWDNMVTLKHKLSCFIPNGEWETEIEVSKQNVRKSVSL